MGLSKSAEQGFAAAWDHAHDHDRHGHQASLDDALDFVNTLQYEKADSVDRLVDLPSAVRWLEDHELLHSEMVDQLVTEDVADRDLHMARIRRVRGALRELLDATVEQRPPRESALGHVNRALRTQYVYLLVPAADGVSLDHRHEGDPISGALARLAEAVARELTQPDAQRLRVCANEECRWVFHDSSPAGRRKWCDMSTCGNRAKVARHRERQKEMARPGTAERAAG